MPIIRHSKSVTGVSPCRNDLEMEDGQGEWPFTGHFVSITELSATDPLYQPMTVTIETLPDHPLLEIFSLYMEEVGGLPEFLIEGRIDTWHTLVHVCQRWRSLVFALSHRLNLRILCTNTRPLREILDLWPALPIVIWCKEIKLTEIPPMPMVGAENIVSALGHRDRVSQISFLGLPLSIFSRFTAIMDASFPVLTHLKLDPYGDDGQEAILEDSFLGGSAPCLRSLRLHRVTFPALHKLLLSTKDLVDLCLVNIPFSDYVSPEGMASCLSSLTKLEDLRLGFSPLAFYPDRNQHLPLTRVDLCHLIRLHFGGTTKYLEDFVARINAPLLRVFQMLLIGPVLLNTPQLTDFVDRAEPFKVLDQAELHFHDYDVTVKLLSQKETVDRTILNVHSGLPRSEGSFLSLEQARSSFLSLISSVECLNLTEDEYWPLISQGIVENAYWLQLLRPFTAVKHLYLSGEPGLQVARTLHELTWEGVVEVWPALQSVFLEGLQPSEDVVDAIAPFIVRRQLSGHPVTVHSWDGKELMVDML